jgi:hypothetical protein
MRDPVPPRDRELQMELELRLARGERLSRWEEAQLAAIPPVPEPTLDDKLRALDSKLPKSPAPDAYEQRRRMIVREIALKRRWQRLPAKIERIEKGLR